MAETKRIWAFDERRFGLRVWLRRRWRPWGTRPPWFIDDRYEWQYAPVEPITGQSFFLFLPGVTNAWFQCFLDAFGKETAGRRVGLVLDGAGSDRAALVWRVRLAPQPPPYSPELNPEAQIFRVLRVRLTNCIFADLANL